MTVGILPACGKNLHDHAIRHCKKDMNVSRNLQI